MSENESTTFALDQHTFGYAVIYLALYRIGIITAGIVSIYLGYRLFLTGLFPYAVAGSSFEASIAGATFGLANAAPGTFFALFGLIVIVVMILKSPPEFKYKTAAGDEVTMRGMPDLVFEDEAEDSRL